MPDQSTVEIRQGIPGFVGGSEVASYGIYREPASKGAPVSAASLSVAIDDPHTRPYSFEYRMVVHAGSLLPTRDGLHRIVNIFPNTGEGRVPGAPAGHLEIAAEPSFASSTGAALYLAQNGNLRLVHQTDVDRNFQVDPVAWQPNDFQPKAVNVEWWGGNLAKRDVSPRDIHRVELETGSKLILGKTVLTVDSIEGRTAEHPAWVRFSAIVADQGPARPAADSRSQSR